MTFTTTTEFKNKIDSCMNGFCKIYGNKFNQYYHTEIDSTIVDDYVILWINKTQWHTIPSHTIEKLDNEQIVEIAKIYFHTLKMWYNIAIDKQ